MTYQKKSRIRREIENQRLLKLRLDREREAIRRLARERDEVLQDIENYLTDFDRKYGDLCNAVS